MEVFTQPYDADGTALKEVSPQVLDEAWAHTDGPRTVFGDGADKAAELWSHQAHILHVSGIRPTAGAMLHAAERRLSAADTDDLAYLVPAYGKVANVGKAKDGTGH